MATPANLRHRLRHDQRMFTLANDQTHGTVQKPEIVSALNTLKSILRRSGLSLGDISKRFEVSQRTVTRWMMGDGLTLSTLSELCGLVDISLADLFEISAQENSNETRHLSLQQEIVLASDNLNAFLFAHLHHGWRVRDLQREVGIPAARLSGALARLESVGLIRCLADDRVRVLVRKMPDWLPNGPMAASLLAFLNKVFIPLQLSDPDLVWTQHTAKLSAASIARLKEKMHEIAVEMNDLAKADSLSPSAERTWQVLFSQLKTIEIGPVNHWSGLVWPGR